MKKLTLTIASVLLFGMIPAFSQSSPAPDKNTQCNCPRGNNGGRCGMGMRGGGPGRSQAGGPRRGRMMGMRDGAGGGACMRMNQGATAQQAPAPAPDKK